MNATPSRSSRNEDSRRPIGRTIVTYGRSDQSLAAAQCLGRHGVEVIACDEAPLMAAAFSKFVSSSFVHPSAFADLEGFLECFEKEIDRFAPDDDAPYVLMPIHRDTRIFAEYGSRLQSKIRIAAPPIEAVREVEPKHHLVETARRLNVSIPSTQILSGESDLKAAGDAVGFPAFLKGAGGSGGKSVFRAEDQRGLEAAFRRLTKQVAVGGDQPALLQEEVAGDDYCAGVLFQDGTYRAGMAYRNVSTYPFAGGSGTVRETIEAEPLLKLSKRLLGPLKWNGVAELDFRWNGDIDSTPVLIEVNPRFWGGLFHSIESGIEFPWLLFQLAAFGVIEEPREAEIGTRTRVPFFSIVSAVSEIEQDAFERLKRKGRAGLEKISSGAFWRGLGIIASGIGEALNPLERLDRFQRFLEENRDAREEVFSADDPAAALGVLYVIASLVRNGRLPEELSRVEAPYPDPDSADSTAVDS